MENNNDQNLIIENIKYSYPNDSNDFINEFKKKNKLSCIMITDTGKTGESVLGVLTTWDIIGRQD